MNVETRKKAMSGWLVLILCIAMACLAVIALCRLISLGDAIDALGFKDSGAFPDLIALVALIVAIVFLMNGLFSLQPGQARICVLFGRYVGTIYDEGLRFANPLYARTLRRASGGEGDETVHGPMSSVISTRLRTLNGEPLKVNDKMGNPIEIATVICWRVADTAKAAFDVDDYESYVTMQTETALRHVASLYAYDHMEEDDDHQSTITLRSDIEQIGQSLKEELDRRLAPAGVTVEDARLTHLAYAPEIAQAMLRRQQADAILAARKKIVEGAVSMVEMAVAQLGENGQIDMDDERKAAMASNLLVVLCGESDAQPVLNTGSLYM